MKSFWRLQKTRNCKTIGVSNFEISQLKKLLEIGEKPAIDQLESSPHFQNDETVRFLKENNILHQSWSPIARGRS